MSNNDDVEFNLFDPYAETYITNRNLPHWFQVGAATFVTFRCKDSLPREALFRMRRELRDWLKTNQLPDELGESVTAGRLEIVEDALRKLSVYQHRLFKSKLNWLMNHTLDQCHGECELRQPDIAAIVADAIRFHDGERYDLDSLIVMPNHVHVIVQFREGFTLKTIGQSWLRYTARLINQRLKTSGPFWQAEPFDHIIRSADQFSFLQNYVADNPRKANLPSNEYLYWTRADEVNLND